MPDEKNDKPVFQPIWDLIKEMKNTNSEWQQPCIDVIDTMSFIGSYFQARNMPFTAADLIEATKLVIRRRETYDTV